jgi:beta-aspartyl-dipeptidase (metallo-type)
MQPLLIAKVIATRPFFTFFLYFGLMQFWPTHVNTRGLDLVRDAVQWVKDGGWADLTCGMPSHSRERAVEDLQSTADMLHELGHDTERCTLSTDAFGSLPTFGPNGELIKYDVGSPRGILEAIKALREGDHGFPFERLIALATENPARLLRLPGKGRIAQGADADIVLLDPESLDVKYAYTRGEIVKTPEWVRGGLFDTGPGVRPRSPPYV